jgi:succinoglycan biosynthesis protein ExoM
VTAAARTLLTPLSYDVEREQNLSLARNRSVRNATGKYVAFIDDDEVPTPRWLVTLYQMLLGSGVDGVLGPVYPKFEVEPPKWLTRSRVAERLHGGASFRQAES